MKPETLNSLLQDLANTKIVKVTGSYADGTATVKSDLDFYVKQDATEQPYSKRNMLKIISVLSKYQILWRSTDVGYITTIGMPNDYLPVELEFSDMFNPRENKKPEVVLAGVPFKTY